MKEEVLFGANAVFVEELYQLYLTDKNAVDQNWQEFFATFNDQKSITSPSWRARPVKIINAISDEQQVKAKETPKADDGKIVNFYKAKNLIEAYREMGHFLADLDPLGLEVKKSYLELGLDLENFGFSNKDLNLEIDLQGKFFNYGKITLGELLSKLKQTYCYHVGYEYSHIDNIEQKEWLKAKIELDYRELTLNEKKKILKDIAEAEGFEQFLHVKFPGVKRFSVEGGASSISALETIIETASNEVQEVTIGMAHRGRLNVLTKITGKPYRSMFSEVQGNLAHPEDLNISGDVKYHLGAAINRKFNGNQVHISLAPNPSHLEAVNAVVAGKVRAKQDQIGDKERSKVMAILIHGDAAFAGQGIIAENLSMSDLAAYDTGGIVHLVINNQIGFTVTPNKARKSRYPTEIAKIIKAPIFHVNGDDPEEVSRICKIALEFKQRFKKDVVIDIVCYRLYGHNEGDEPLFTQPLMYKKIHSLSTSADLYAAKLTAENLIKEQEYIELKEKFKEFLEQELEAAKTFKPSEAEWLKGKWSHIERGVDFKTQPKTGVDLAILKQLGANLCKYKEHFKINSKIERQLDAKAKMIETGEGIDWGTGEALAFASLLTESYNIRITGQDSCRGTFSHRHSVLIDQETEEKYMPLNNIQENQAKYEVHDSNLSEYGVLGFEYGYSTTEPNSLVIWEAQFGDFANGAQIVVDQFISSAETKWQQMSGLVMLLPHAYEGMGPEHSSARLERYLELCAENNMQVVNCTTPASFFHALRRQLHSKYRKPLIVMSPKSLLRHRLAISNMASFASGTSFERVIGETNEVIKNDKVTKLVICSGKIYYDLIDARHEKQIDNIAIIRLEQLYPFPSDRLQEEFNKYPNAALIWCQEESENMGAWSFVRNKINELDTRKLTYIGRKESASPAAGYLKMHLKESLEIINKVFV